ncbi:hypothetical protein TUBRATIS_006700 [Tubulinosema ratisbonensis]|uniref:Uncharacterized protein n=1 Tax=Tubulinosema ratisbonensis TaxID=291195 RepID=A0A437AP68_9MICR|nr:hypothetical protein TUBRATIS_006700 [Tubulinosema ratisbonensis]
MNNFELQTGESDQEDLDNYNETLISLLLSSIQIFCLIFDWFLIATLIHNCIKCVELFTWFKIYTVILILVFAFSFYREKNMKKSISNLLTCNENAKLVLLLSNLLLFSSSCCKDFYSLVKQHKNLSYDLNSGSDLDCFPFINLGLNVFSLGIISSFSFTLFLKSKTDVQSINLNTLYKHFAFLLIFMGVSLSFYFYWFNIAPIIKEFIFMITFFIIVFCVLPVFEPKKYLNFRNERKLLIITNMIRICCLLIKFSGFIDYFYKFRYIYYKTN